jgi:hypothetical protein
LQSAAAVAVLPLPTAFVAKRINQNHSAIDISNFLASFMLLLSRNWTNGECRDLFAQIHLEIDTSCSRQVQSIIMRSMADFVFPANDLSERSLDHREVDVETVLAAVSIVAIVTLTLFSLGLSAYPLLVLWLI